MGKRGRNVQGNNDIVLWSPTRTTVFLHIWNLLTPLKIILSTSGNLNIIIYAGLWSYLPGNPYSTSPIVVSILLTLFMFPFYSPGIIVATYVWRGFKNPNLSRYTYLEQVLLLQVVYILIIWIFIPCPISANPLLCIPVPSTGIMALLLASKVVRKLDSPWDESTVVEDSN